MWFKNEEHKQNYEYLLVIYDGHDGHADSESISALYVLAAVGKSKVIDSLVSRGEIDFPKLLRVCRPWSSGEKAMVKLAASLFNQFNYKAIINDVFRPLDQSNTTMVLEALKLRYSH